jgi:hypothetical protein
MTASAQGTPTHSSWGHHGALLLTSLVMAMARALQETHRRLLSAMLMVARVDALICTEEDWANKEMVCAAERSRLGVRYGSVGACPTILKL